jgi:prepilin-type N-terminal cleavage/methylation domain-containing protein
MITGETPKDGYEILRRDGGGTRPSGRMQASCTARSKGGRRNFSSATCVDKGDRKFKLPHDESASRLQRGFTLIELLVTIALMGVLASLLLSALSRAKEHARRIKCINNLKQIAVAAKTFGLDHDGKLPWHVPTSEGGTYGRSAEMAWRNYSALSNELVSPQLLVCPSDTATRKIAWTWPELLSASFRSNAISYFVGLDGLRAGSVCHARRGSEYYRRRFR